jgi:hypothetical protein
MVRSFALAALIWLAVDHAEVAKVSNVGRELELGEALVLIFEDFAFVREGVMNGIENKKVPVGNLASFVVVCNAKGEFNAFLDEGIDVLTKNRANAYSILTGVITSSGRD